MSMLSFRRVLLAKVESAYGTDPVPVPATDAIDARKISFSEAGEQLERDLIRGTLSRSTPILGKRHAEIKFECDLKGSGLAGVAPMISDLLLACGLAESVSIGSSVVYSPVSLSTKSVTIYLYDLGDTNSVLRKITGARGDFKINCEAGQIGKIEFTFRGVYNAPTDETSPTGMVYETTKPPIVQSASFSWGANTSLIVRQISIEMNNELADQDDISSAYGIKGFMITSRRPSGSFNPEMVNIADEDFNSDWAGNTENLLSLEIGTVAGNKVNIECAKASIDNVGEDEQDNILYKNIPFRANMTNGDDEICIKFK